MDRIAVPLDVLATDALLLPNRYRIGDTVALLTLMQWIDERVGKKRWAFENLPGSIATLVPLTGYPFETVTSGADTVAVFDDVNLWVWNDLFRKAGYQPTWKADEGYFAERLFFAPLLQVGYSTGRLMRLRTACEIVERLSEITFVTVVQSPDMTDDDVDRLREAGAGIFGASLADVIEEVRSDAWCYVGCDTGLSHVVARFPHVRQIALHDRRNTERHQETEFDHLSEHKALIGPIVEQYGTDAERAALESLTYDSVPNKDGIETVLFDRHGADGTTPERIADIVRAWHREGTE